MTDKVKAFFIETNYDYRGDVRTTLQDIANDIVIHRGLNVNIENYNVSDLVEFIGQQLVYYMYENGGV